MCRGWKGPHPPRALLGSPACLPTPPKIPQLSLASCRVLGFLLSPHLVTSHCSAMWVAQKIQELEATPARCAATGAGAEGQRGAERGPAGGPAGRREKLRRQILRQSREFDSQILRERMELLQQAQQVGEGPAGRGA